jgi:hypothetical protein
MPNNLIELRCVPFESNEMVVFEMSDYAKFYLRCERQVAAVSAQIIAINYVLFSDKELVRFALVFSLPPIYHFNESKK